MNGSGGEGRLGLAGVIAQAFADSKLTPLILAFALPVGVFATLNLPREEEPQIVVPMIDVFVSMPGISVREVEERVTKPIEKLLWEISGVEYVYSTTSPGGSMVIVRFYVGEDEEDAIVRVNQKMFANFDLIPPGASEPLIKPRSIDDVPILGLTLHSERYGDYERRIAGQLHDGIKQVHDVSAVEIIGGQRREIQVELNEAKLAAYGFSALEISGRLGAANRSVRAGEFDSGNRRVILETGRLLTSARDVEDVVVGVSGGRPVYVRDVAVVRDGGEEPSQYVRFASEADTSFQPAVTIAVSKRKGANAIDVAEHVLTKVEQLRGRFVPSDAEVAITRNYGETAQEKSSELLGHMATAVVAVAVLIWFTLGFRESWIVFLAIPATLGPTLACFYIYGYTLNRITLFALIFSIGILVDDAIVVVENVARHARMPGNRGRPLSKVAVEAVGEIGNPVILATFAVIAAVMPMAFVGGLMGPYMAPIPVGSSSAMVISMLVAFIITPWAAIRFLKPRGENEPEEKEDWTTRLYRRIMSPLLHRPALRYGFLLSIVVLLVGAMALVRIGLVRVKMLPFDNKSEFQVIVDMPEGTSLERTARVTQNLAERILEEPEVVNVQTYAGTAAPYNFNGLVRHYFLRGGPHEADIQVNLVPKEERDLQSHDIAKRTRTATAPLAVGANARVKIAEVPPGPPVLKTLVAEIYGPDSEGRERIARAVRDIFESTDGVVDADWYVEDDQRKLRYVVDGEKAALHGVSTEQIARLVAMASSGYQAGLIHDADEKEDVPLTLRLERAARSSTARLEQLRVAGATARWFRWAS